MTPAEEPVETHRVWAPFLEVWRRFREADLATKGFVLAVLGWIVGMAVYACLRYYAYDAYAFDLGIFNQAFSTALQGRLFYETPDTVVIASGSFLGTHFNLLMFLLLPIYALAPRPETLLVVQATAIGLGAVPVWLLAKHVLSDRRLALGLALAFLFNPGTLSLAIYDFHLEAFLPFFLGMTFYTFLVRRWRLHALFLVLSVVTIEFAGIFVAVLAAAHVVRALRVRPQPRAWWRPISIDLDRTQKWVAVGTMVLGPIAFYGMLFASVRISGPLPATATHRSIALFTFGLVTPALVNQWIEFWLVLAGVLLFLPLLAPRSLIPVAPWFFLTVVAVASTWFELGYQYAGAFAAPFLVWAAVFGLRRFQRLALLKGLVTGMVVASILVCPLNPMTHGVFPGIAYAGSFPLPTSHDALVDLAVSMIPANASVLTQNNLFPHVSGRPNAYLFLLNRSDEPDYVLADMTSWTYTQPIWNRGSLSAAVASLLATGDYGVVVYQGGVLLLERGYRGPMVLAPTPLRYDYRSLYLYSGGKVMDPTSESGVVLVHNATASSGVTFWYGPYRPLAPGTYNATFRMKVGAGAVGGLTLDVSVSLNSTAAIELVRRSVAVTDFPTADAWTNITLTFSLPASEGLAHPMEYRGFAVQGGPFYLDTIVVTYVGAPLGG